MNVVLIVGVAVAAAAGVSVGQLLRREVDREEDDKKKRGVGRTVRERGRKWAWKTARSVLSRRKR